MRETDKTYGRKKRPHVVGFRVSTEELARLDAMAEAAGLTRHAFIRREMLGPEVIEWEPGMAMEAGKTYRLPNSEVRGDL